MGARRIARPGLGTAAEKSALSRLLIRKMLHLTVTYCMPRLGVNNFAVCLAQNW